MIERERDRQREKQAPCQEPDVGLDPRTPGSCPGPKAGAKPLSHPGIPLKITLKNLYKSWIVSHTKTGHIWAEGHSCLASVLDPVTGKSASGNAWMAQQFGACFQPRA